MPSVLTVLTMAYAVGHISGGHFNPAVTLGLVAGGRFSAKMPFHTSFSQVVGGLVGVLHFTLSHQVKLALMRLQVLHLMATANILQKVIL